MCEPFNSLHIETQLATCIDNPYSPALTTAFVCSEVPEAMFVKAQAASN